MKQKAFSPEYPLPWRYEQAEYDNGNGTSYCYYVYDASGDMLETLYDEDLAKTLVEFSKKIHQYGNMRTLNVIENKITEIEKQPCKRAYEALVNSHTTRILKWASGKLSDEDLDLSKF